MSSKKDKKVLPEGVVIAIGIVFIFLFFTTTTLTLTQVRNKSAQHEKMLENAKNEKILRLGVARKEKLQMKERMLNEKKGVLLSFSDKEIVVEIGKPKEEGESEILSYKITDNTIVILTSKESYGKEGSDDMVGNVENLTEGATISIREGDGELKKTNAKIIRIFE
ncbi:hypothetical protein HN784_02600 [bacterium]|jgi:hypothetical protein|nr:hypothetical protein [bacterium]MBT4250849.1 hypothetical protein [bacterium]MBT4597561.1 hypothetical protein [bacterium]MBT6754027.1 hypothetical protein [bacterium]MBT7038057.1 hypothetical protein [bacterium]